MKSVLKSARGVPALPLLCYNQFVNIDHQCDSRQFCGYA